MHSVFFSIEGIAIRWYGMMMALAFLSGLFTLVHLGKARGKDLNYCSDLLWWVMLSGIFGARAAYVIANWRDFAMKPWTVFYIHQGGLIYYGGLVAAGAAVFVFARRHKTALLELTDFVVTALPLGHALGRIGCLLNGCCYGRRYNGLLGLRYPPQSAPWLDQVDAGIITSSAPASLPVIPVQLLEAGYNVIVFLILLGVYRRNKESGTVTAMYLILYAAGRFSFEFLRGDPRMFLGPLDVAQWLSLIFCVAGCGMLLLVTKTKKEWKDLKNS
jgi:phosphatidylglycerol---prolipoprotein diacylglyceryl transferase